jgi:putative transcriptional regulator
LSFLQGQFLVASPHLGDPNFHHTVILMIQHDDEGAFGVVVNRPLSETVADVWRSVSDEPCSCTDLVREGGPVPGPPLLLHKMAEFSQFEVLPGLHMASHRHMVTRLVTRGDEFLFFTGYSGWGAGQLENEMEAGGWLHTPANLETVFADVDEMWKRVADAIGREILQSSLPELPMSDDASWN